MTKRDRVVVPAFCAECDTVNAVSAGREQLGKYLLDQQTVQVLFYSMTTEEQRVLQGFRDGAYLCGDCWNDFTEEVDE